ncbi:MAG: hypothetical protein M3451_09815 [Chloroflexota bacterium]|jgi:hypothetical protein|nr:hypothetical protein [Chloroflexota bacterium]
MRVTRATGGKVFLARQVRDLIDIMEVNDNTIRFLNDGALVVDIVDNRLLSGTLGRAGIYSAADWQLNVQSFKIKALGDGVAISGDNQSIVAQGDSANIASLLPSDSDVSALLVLAGEQSRSLAEVAANYTDPAEITAIFSGWGWQGNVTRAFAMPDGVYPEQTQINGVYVSIHAFGSPQAAAALDYSMMDQAASTGAYEVSVTPLGDYSRALLGEMSFDNEITLLVQRSNLLIRLSTAQLEGDASGVAVGIMQGILGRMG